ncbi:MAG: TlpA family protein disulfide reductase, partial [Bacteroidetes bacterium]|nr:TlpA family protein disulfide reductase [Bacteroidota bacterium]
KGKVTIIQIMGSWCPNCMDESTLLQEQYMKYTDKGFNVIALAYEKTTDTALARQRVQRFKQRLKCTYPFLITGKTGKDDASGMFPMLNEIVAFPTTIYIDKKGVIRKVYTGFNGPGTGTYYEKSKLEMTQYIELLLNE